MKCPHCNEPLLQYDWDRMERCAGSCENEEFIFQCYCCSTRFAIYATPVVQYSKPQKVDLDTETSW